MRKLLFRLALLAAAVGLVPFGLMIFQGAFQVGQPQVFVMLVFSGSLSLLVGLTGLFGLIISFRKAPPPEQETGAEESRKPPVP